MKFKNLLMATIGIAVSAAGALACGDDGEKPPTAPPSKAPFVGLSVENGNTALKWKADGKTYDVYSSPSRYGEYELKESGITDGEFTDGSRFNYYKVCEVNGGEIVKQYEISEEGELFGKNTFVLSPDDDADKVKAAIDGVYGGRAAEDKMGEFSEERTAFLLKSGTYNKKIELNVGYYMTYAGLGETPNDVTVSKLYCNNRKDIGNALCNFWRGAENFTVNSTVKTLWATSQSSSLRSVNINGDLDLSDPTGEGYASGGFLADCNVAGTVSSGQQQQWFSRNSKWKKWNGNMWNMCFAGIDGAPSGEYPAYKYTVEETTSMREKPFLTFDATNGSRIAVPAVRENAVGYSWSEDNISTRIEKYIPQSDIYFARADRDTAQTITDAYKTHSAVVLTPGVYYTESAVNVQGDGKLLYGMGLATVIPLDGNECLVTSGSDISVSGVLFDAGMTRSDTLVSIGKAGESSRDARLFDCYFRVGGFLEANTSAECSLKVYSDDSTLDNLWIWRADHGNNIGWSKNNGDTGAEIYGDNVTAYTLMAEHYKKHNVSWYGENGKIMFYQSEIAYDVPTQSVWRDKTKRGFSSLHVDDGVNVFTARGLGVYSNFHVSGIRLDSAITVPKKQGITIEHACTVALNRTQSIINIVNDVTVEPEANAGLLNRYLTKYRI